MSWRALAERPPPVRHGNVSSTSAMRFAARVRSRRRHRWAAAAAAVTVLGALGWLLLGSTWLRVNAVQVSGTVRLDPSVVSQLAESELSRPMLLARTGDVRDRVARLQLATGAQVSRQWPATLRIRVTERVPAAAVPGPDGSVRLVDTEGVVVETTSRAPAGLPQLQLEAGNDPGLGGSAVRSCLTVLAGLPDRLRDQVASLGASSPDGVWLELDGGARVQWGGPEETPLKVRVLQVLLAKKAAGYDVSAPLAPAIRKR